MIQITAHMHIVAAVEPVDFRKGIDGLAAVCRQQLQSDPFCGAVFVFVNKSKTALRLLIYDGQGFWLCHKRLSKGRFIWNFHRHDPQTGRPAAPGAAVEQRSGQHLGRRFSADCQNFFAIIVKNHWPRTIFSAIGMITRTRKEVALQICGRDFTPIEIDWINEQVQMCPDLNRVQLVKAVLPAI